MIYLIHGDDEHRQRKFILELKGGNDRVLLEFPIAELTIADILNKYSSSDLFGKKIIFVLDITKEKNYDFDALVKGLQGKNPKNDLLFVSRSALGKTHKLIKAGFNTKEFTQEAKPNTFSFLDALIEKRKKDAYRELSILENLGVDEFEIMSMVIYGYRNIALAIFESKALLNLHPYVKGKLSSQIKKYNRAEIVKIFELLYNHDLGLKTGRLSYDITIPLLIEKVTG